MTQVLSKRLRLSESRKLSEPSPLADARNSLAAGSSPATLCQPKRVSMKPEISQLFVHHHYGRVSGPYFPHCGSYVVANEQSCSGEIQLNN